MSQFTAFFDANVLYPSSLRSFIMYVIKRNLFRAKWSDMVHEEWIRSVLENVPGTTREKLEVTRRKMNEHALDCLATGFEDLIEGIDLPDKNDRHVLAAAIVSKAGVIVTKNLKHFPAKKLEAYGMEAQHPDEFITHLLDLYEDEIVDAAKEHRASMRNPPKSPAEYLEVLERQGLLEAVKILRSRESEI